MPYRQTDSTVPPKPQIHVVDWQSDKVLGTFVNKTGSNVFFDDMHEMDAKENIETFEFTTLVDYEPTQYLRDMNRVLIPGEDGDFHEFIIDEVEQDSYGTVTVRCVASYMELRKQAVIPPRNDTGATLPEVLPTIFDQTEWQVNEIEYTGVEPIKWREYSDAFAAIKSLLEIFDVKVEFLVEVRGSRVVRRYANFRRSLDTFTGKEVELGKDLERITRKESTADVVTALRVVGPENDQDDFRMNVLVEDNEALQRWGRGGRHLVGLYEPDIPEGVEVTESILEELGEKQLERMTRSAVEYEADAVSIEYIFGRAHEKVRLNDVVRVKDTGFSPPLYLEARVTKIQRMVSDPTRKLYEIGDFIGYEERSISRFINRLYDKVEARPTGDDVDEKVEESRSELEDRIDEAREELEDMLDQAQIRLDDLEDNLNDAYTEIDNAKSSISDAQDIIDGITEVRGNVHVLSGTLVTNEIIAENAVLTGTLIASGATILNLTTENMTAVDAYIDNATFNSGVSQEMSIFDAYIERAIIEDATITGELVGVTGTFTGTLSGGTIDVDTDATVGQNLVLGRSFFGGDHTIYFGGTIGGGPRIFRRSDSLRIHSQTSFVEIEGTSVNVNATTAGVAPLTVNGTSVRSADIINSGTFNSNRIPNLSASKITTGTFAASRIPTDMNAYIKSAFNQNLSIHISNGRAFLRQDGSTVGEIQLI